ncbi:twin-arginine translocation signal domain-containing protein [Sinorhizobium medicae]|nr:twin-arginine translocation signal domain-containing protein [Sinorhizobium medicae]MDX0901631.1 twin-arginine translocation signal domain-containing protein [Sinorhizobium medicae]MDX1177403.1 twin-arginine translocation signal domain-containing protein [Sinorhizobium medicae]
MMAKKGALSRRDFMQLAAAVGIAVPMASTLFSKAQAQEPKKGGNLKLGVEGGSASDSWDPRTYSDSIMMMASLTIMNGLIEFDSEGKATGELLESWDVQPGAQKWVFNVRKDVTFSNGKKLDADDIVYSIQIHHGETKSPARGLLQQIQEIKALSPHQVGITLSSGNIDFPAILGDNHIVVIPKDHTDWQYPVGTGAYVLESLEPGVRIAVKNRGESWLGLSEQFRAFC